MEGSPSKTIRFDTDGDSEGRVKERNANEVGNEADGDPDKEMERQVSLFAPLRKIVHFTLEDATKDPNKILELLDEEAASRPTTRNKTSRGSYGIRDDTSAPTSPTQPGWENSGLESQEETKEIEEKGLEGDTSEEDTKPQDTSEETVETSEEEPAPPLDTRSATLEVPSKENVEEKKSADQVLLDLEQLETPPKEEPKEDDASSYSGSGSYRSPTSQSPRKENISFETKEKLIKMVQEAKIEKEMLKEQSKRFQSVISAFFKSPKVICQLG